MKYQFYISEKFEIYTNNTVVQDNYGHSYTIVKFINHHRRKNKKENYLVVRLQCLEYKTKVLTVPVELLETYEKISV